MSDFGSYKPIGKTKEIVMASFVLLLTLITFSLVAHAGPAATQYGLELIDAPLPGHDDFPAAPWTEVTDINDHGIAVWSGETVDPDFDTNFLLNDASGIYDIKKGKFITLWEGTYNLMTGEETTLWGTSPYGINNRGALATSDCAYIDKKGEVIELTHPLYDDCFTRGVASNGLISGFTIDNGGTWRGFVYNPKDESFDDFLPDADRNIAQGINSRTQVVGDIGPGTDREGYVRNSDGSARFFKVNIDGVRYFTQARGISADGTIVGSFRTDTALFNGFVGRLSDDPDDEDLIPSAVFTPENTPECDFGVFLTRINSKGVISGWCASDGWDAQRGLLLTPIAKGKK